MDELMHIDKYKIYNMGYKWTGGKKDKKNKLLNHYILTLV